MRTSVTGVLGVAVAALVVLLGLVAVVVAQPNQGDGEGATVDKAERAPRTGKDKHRPVLDVSELDLSRRYDVRLDDGGTVRVLSRVRIVAEVGPEEGTVDTGTYLPFDGWLVLQPEDGPRTVVPIERIVALEEPARRL